jgi:hypothetical protein
MAARSTTVFTSRGRVKGLIREDAPAGTGLNRTGRDEPGRPSIDEALYYRARLILGESLARPGR